VRFTTLAFLAAFLFISTHASAQTTATTGNKFQWTEVGQSVAIAQAATYNVYVDSATTGTALTGIACVAGTPASNAVCTSNLPAFTVGPHTAAVSQLIGGAESAKSNTLAFSFVVVVQPTLLQIVKAALFHSGGVLTHRGRVGLKKVQMRDLRVIPAS